MSAIENMRKMINLMETAVGRSRRRVNEGKMKELWMLIKQGKSAEEIAEILNVDIATIKSFMAKEGLGEESGDDAATHEQIGAFKDWFNKWNQLKSKDVYDYAEGIIQAAIHTGVSELDGRSDEDPNLDADGELFAIFPELDRGDIEAIANKLEAVGINATEPDAAGWE